MQEVLTTAAGTIVMLAAWAGLLLMAAAGFRLAANARIEEERLKAKAEAIRRANKIAEVQAREIIKHATFTVRIVPVNESDIKWR